MGGSGFFCSKYFGMVDWDISMGWMDKYWSAIGVLNRFTSSVADPDPDPNPDPPDPHVLGPSGSGSFYYHAKIVRKTLIPTIL